MSPKLPTIYLSTSIMDTDLDITASKINAIPYIDKESGYPMMDNQPMICVLQLNMDQIFLMLKDKKSDKVIDKYFSTYPKTGLLQFFLKYSKELDDDIVYVMYIKNYDAENHDIKMAQKLVSLYKNYHKNITETNLEDTNKLVYITDAVYAYSFANSTLDDYDEDDNQNHEPIFLNKYNTTSEFIWLGGYPYFIQDGFEFNEKKHTILISICNSLTSFNISIKKKNLTNLEFDDLDFDLAYD